MTNQEESSEVLFINANASERYPLDNFADFPVALWNEVFKSAEHAFQWRKFDVAGKSEIAAMILAAQTPLEAKALAREYKDERVQNWGDIKVAVMEEILRAKLAQNKEVETALRETVGKRLYENNPGDAFWGTGPHGDGKNIMGDLWTKLREEMLVTPYVLL